MRQPEANSSFIRCARRRGFTTPKSNITYDHDNLFVLHNTLYIIHIILYYVIFNSKNLKKTCRNLNAARFEPALHSCLLQTVQEARMQEVVVQISLRSIFMFSLRVFLIIQWINTFSVNHKNIIYYFISSYIRITQCTASVCILVHTFKVGVSSI